jgi:hypothetical protein
MSDDTELLTERLIALKTGEMASMMLHLGLRLGLIEAMRSRGAIRVDELADVRENLENPMGALLYGISIAFCMSSSMSTPDGAGLGTMGLSAKRARRIAEAAGFSRFRQLDYDEDPLNAFYEIRP